MGKDFIRVATSTDIPADKDAQIRIILEGRVYDSLYRKFMSTAPNIPAWRRLGALR
jgi:hypothetical protein